MKRSKSRILLVPFALVFALAIAGCSTGGTNASSSSNASSTNAPATEQADYTNARVSYLGPEGTYTQEACQVFFGGKGTYVPAADVAASVEALLQGESDYAVIPQENAIGGPIAEYVDEVANHEQVSIVGEVELPIDQNLLVTPGAKLEDIRTVYSHKQGIAQGSEWLTKNVPEAEVVEVSSTAEGAKLAAEDKGGASAAIGARAAADVYGLEVAAEAIQMNSNNKTRFYVLSLEAPVAQASDRMAFTAAGSADDLAELLESVEGAGLTVVAVHDRPQKTELGHYTYVVECAGGGHDAFDAVQKERSEFTFRYLGSFPVMTP